MKKRKVLFITPSLCQGGIEHSQITMLKLLDREKYDLTLFLYLKDVTLLPLVPDYVKVIIDEDNNHYYRKIEAIKLSLQKRICSLFGFEKLYYKYSEELRDHIHEQRAMHPARDIFKNEKFDVVVSNAIGICTEMAQYISADKRYVFFRSSVDLHHEMLEKVFPKYDGIVAVSNGVKEMLQESYPHVKDKVILLEDYVSAETILYKASDKNSEYQIDVDNDTITICSCGRLSPEKGFDMAVESAALLAKNGYKFKWYFIGDGQERERIERLIANYSLEDKVYITGYMDNPFSFMKLCDIYVQPSYEESYGRTIKEAMILGKPVVSTATVGGNTLIKNGESGILTEINAEALAEGIISFIVNKELREGCAKSYSLEQNISELMVFKERLEKLLS